MIGPIRHKVFVLMTFFAVFTVQIPAPMAADIWMSDEDLETTFSGKTIAGIYPSGRGFVETFNVGGRVYYRDDQRRVYGRWSISAQSFCTLYDGDASGGCFLVRRMSENCYEFYFASRSERKAQRPENHSWSAQAWIYDKPSTCVAGSEV